MKPTLVVLGTVALVLAGCAQNEPPAPTTTEAPPMSANPAFDPRTPQPPGTVVPLSGGSAGLQDLEVEVTVFAVDQNIAQSAIVPLSGGHWAGADVQTCVKKSFRTFTVGWSDWSVSDAQNGQYRASGEIYDEFPTPQYPFSKDPIAVGECVRGWVLFPVAFGVQVTVVKYKPTFSAPAFSSAV